MRIVVLLHAPRLAPDSETVLKGIAPCDLAALRTALELADGKSESVTAVTAGPQSDEIVLLRAAQLGAGRVVRFYRETMDTDNLWQLSGLIARGVKQLGFDLALAGDRSANWGGGTIGPSVAHRLGIPHLSGAERVSVGAAGRLEVARTWGSRRVTMELPLPVLITLAANGPSGKRVAPQASPPSPETLCLTDGDLGVRRTMAPAGAAVRPQLEPASATSTRMFSDADALGRHLKSLGVMR